MNNAKELVDFFDFLTGETGKKFSCIYIGDEALSEKPKADKRTTKKCNTSVKRKDENIKDGFGFSLPLPPIRRILFNDPATIVFWGDDTKTIVKCMKGEKYERYAGFAAACMKKLFGSTLHAKDIMEKYGVDQQEKVREQNDKKEKPACVGKRVAIDELAVGVNHDAIREAVNEALNG